MGRIRYMKPDFFKDEDLGGLPFETRLLFAGLWGIADKSGRLEDRPIRIKAEVFPYDAVDIEKNLCLLATTKTYGNGSFIQRYAVEGKKFIQLSNWEKHQKPHHTEKESEIPPEKVLIVPMGNGDGERVMGNGECSRSECDVKQPLNNGEVTVKSDSLEDFVSYWKTKPRLKQIRALTDKRRQQLKSRFSERMFSENWKEIIDKFAISDFCFDKNWATFDFVIQNDTNGIKILEGKYDNEGAVVRKMAPDFDPTQTPAAIAAREEAKRKYGGRQ